jgi:hypothetical protein
MANRSATNKSQFQISSSAAKAEVSCFGTFLEVELINYF